MIDAEINELIALLQANIIRDTFELSQFTADDVAESLNQKNSRFTGLDRLISSTHGAIVYLKNLQKMNKHGAVTPTENPHAAIIAAALEANP